MLMGDFERRCSAVESAAGDEPRVEELRKQGAMEPDWKKRTGSTVKSVSDLGPVDLDSMESAA